MVTTLSINFSPNSKIVDFMMPEFLLQGDFGQEIWFGNLGRFWYFLARDGTQTIKYIKPY